MRSFVGAVLMMVALSGQAQDLNPVSEEGLIARDSWQKHKAVLRVGGQARLSGRISGVYLFQAERTPSGRLAITLGNASTGAKEGMFLQQDANSMVLKNGETGFPPAPWQVAVPFVGAPLEPAMALSWSLGLPAASPFVGAEPAALGFGKQLVIEQEGWRSRIDAWQEVEGISFPKHVVIESSTGRMELDIMSIQGFDKAPTGYQEFQLQ